MDIPKGKTREEIKARERIIKDFYTRWVSKNPSKSVWNGSLKAEIKVKGLSYNETVEHAARSYESTVAVFQLTEILSKAVKVSSGPKKQDDHNQKVNTSNILFRRRTRLMKTKNKSRLGRDFRRGSNQAYAQKGCQPFSEIPVTIPLQI